MFSLVTKGVPLSHYLVKVQFHGLQPNLSSSINGLYQSLIKIARLMYDSDPKAEFAQFKPQIT